MIGKHTILRFSIFFRREISVLCIYKYVSKVITNEMHTQSVHTELLKHFLTLGEITALELNSLYFG